MDNIKKIKLFASCIVVKGYERSLICDVQRNSYDFIPNDLGSLLDLHEGKSLDGIKKAYNNQYDEIIDEYVEFLMEKEYVFLTANPEWFPKMDLRWQSPYVINNAIIDVGEDLNIIKIFGGLDKLRCRSVEMRFFNEGALQLIEDVLFYLDKQELIVNSLGFVLPYYDFCTVENLQDVILNNSRISYFIITNSPAINFVEPLIGKTGYIYFSDDEISSHQHCGLIATQNFVVNTKLFTESQNHNTCLNRKISIDKEGNIKNCPSMKENYGNIKDTTLEEALNHPDFKKYWNINKDQITVCKDCEFRHICTDCRAYTENPDDQYSKPLKCGYDPYTNVWEEWSANPLKQKAIDYYGMHELVNKDA